MKRNILSVFAAIVNIKILSVKWVVSKDLLYSNANGMFTFDEVNYANRNYQLCLNNFRVFKLINKKDTILYRLTSKNPIKVWRWADYLFNKKYKLPYKLFKEVEKIRGAVENKTAWQAF